MTDETSPRSRDQFEGALRQLGKNYWRGHPFHDELHRGRLSRSDIQAWVSNRWYYQKSLPIKDAYIIANCPVVEVRRLWINRILYQDGAGPDDGGLSAWLRLGDAVGLSREEILDERHVVPGVRFAADAYVEFARTKPWIQAVASSLTELFSPDLMQDRLTALREHYPWIDPAGHQYFADRPGQARQDATAALELVLQHCTTRPEQDAAIDALRFKCDVLWAMLDGINQIASSR